MSHAKVKGLQAREAAGSQAVTGPKHSDEQKNTKTPSLQPTEDELRMSPSVEAQRMAQLGELGVNHCVQQPDWAEADIYASVFSKALRK